MNAYTIDAEILKINPNKIFAITAPIIRNHDVVRTGELFLAANWSGRMKQVRLYDEKYVACLSGQGSRFKNFTRLHSFSSKFIER